MRYVTVDNTRYRIRGPYTARRLKELYASFCIKYGESLSFKNWLITRGKVYNRV